MLPLCDKVIDVVLAYFGIVFLSAVLYMHASLSRGTQWMNKYCQARIGEVRIFMRLASTTYSFNLTVQ